MLGSKRLSLPSLIEMCRNLRHYLGAGLTVADAFSRQAKKGAGRLREVAAHVSADLKRGHALAYALHQQADAFPPLLLSLVEVGEQTGNLAEVFAELEKFYLRQQQLRRQFVGQIAWPVIQFVLAVFVVAGLIYFLGVINQRQGPNSPPYDPLGLGLSGASGAITFLGIVAGTIVLLYAGYLLLTRALRQRAAVDALLLRLPAIGPCLRALALTRFCLSLRLTFETGMSIAQALELSLRATGNEAFAAHTGEVHRSVDEGIDLTTILARTRSFPEDFVHVIAVGEESGRLHDVLRQQGEQYHEEAGRRLSALTRMSGLGIWLLIGGLIVFTIFRLYASYLGTLSGF
jgi:type IV pilus assembly protein PilC